MRPRRRTLERIDHHQNFHEVVVGGDARRLQHEDVASAHILEQLDHHFAVGEAADDAPPEAQVHVLHHRLGELGIRAARKDSHALKRHRVRL